MIGQADGDEGDSTTMSHRGDVSVMERAEQCSEYRSAHDAIESEFGYLGSQIGSGCFGKRQQPH